MGSGLKTRRGTLRKPAECKPGPKPPIVLPFCVCSVDLAGLPPPYYIRALVRACAILRPAGETLIVSVSSVPALAWIEGTHTYNCATGGYWYSSVAIPGTFYRVNAVILWPDGSTCEPTATIVYSP